MIKSVKRGVLLSRFWYIRGLNPRIISHTGLTRDGTFLIENGKISRPVTNFRFNQSLAELLQNVEMLGRPTRVAASENSSVGLGVVVPALTVRGFFRPASAMLSERTGSAALTRVESRHMIRASCIR